MEKSKDAKEDIGSGSHDEVDLEASSAIQTKESQQIPTTSPLMDWEKGLVGWDSDTDPANPLQDIPSLTLPFRVMLTSILSNWSKWKKRLGLIFMGATSTISPLASSLVAPAIVPTMAEFSVTNSVVGSLMVTIYLMGFCIGPLILAPLSEMLGRYKIMVFGTWFLNLWLLACALAPSMSSLIVFRLLAGIGGSAAMTIAPAVCADIFPIEHRARSTAIITLAQCCGPTVGPLIGSFVTQSLGWRWDYWFLLILSGSATAPMTLFMHETYAPVLLQRKAKKLRKETGRTDLMALLSKDISRGQLLKTSIVRPLKLLFLSPIVSLICLYISAVYGVLYLWFTTIPTAFENTYHWPSQLIGLAYIGIGVAMALSLVIIMHTNDTTVVRLTKRNHGVYEPEFRLPSAIYFAPFIPISLFWYGWSLEKEVQYMCPIIGMTLYGFGMLGLFVPMQQYLVDAYSVYSASAVATIRTSISLFGAFLPIAGPPLFDSLGIGMGNTVLGIITLAMVPIPWLFMKYGKAIRKRWLVPL